MKRKRNRLWLFLALTVLWIGFILERTLKPAEISSEESEWILGLMQGAFPGVTDHLVRKTAHFVEYFVLGLLLRTDFRLLGKRILLPAAGIGLAVAAADELIQTAVPGRSGQVSDVLLDFSGVCAALLAAGGLRLLHARIKKRKLEKDRWKTKKSCTEATAKE